MIGCGHVLWPDESLSRAEIGRRYVLVETESLKNLSATDGARLAHEFRASIEVEHQRLRS